LAYRVEIRPTAQKQLLSLPKEAQLKIASSIDQLKDVPRPPKVKKLAEGDLWRIRVGHYRVVYAVDDETRLIIVVRVAWRKENTYRGL